MTFIEAIKAVYEGKDVGLIYILESDQQRKDWKII